MSLRRRDFLALPAAAAPTPRPNFVFVLVDDLRFDELGCTGHPFAQTPNCDRLAREGANFANAFATTPLCSPSRASFLTGQYAHRHGVTDNVARDALSHRLLTWPRLLHDAGYETAFIGKWHMGNDDSPRPGFTRWVSFRGQGTCFDPALNIDGRAESSTGYITDILSAHAADFAARKRSAPFCLYLAHKAIHPDVQQNDDGSVAGSALTPAELFRPAPRHANLYAGASLPRRANYRVPPQGQPALASVANASPGTGDATILNRARMMKAVDEGLGRILEALESSGQLGNTMVIFTSDHGYFYGEHGLGPERRLAYEEAIRIPLLIRYPPAFRPASKPRAMTLSIDIAPTALSLAGLTPPPEMQGRPIGQGPAREAILIEYFSDTVFANVRNMGYQAIRTTRAKYIRYRDRQNENELYDLRRDPYETRNLLSGRPAPEWERRLGRLYAQLQSRPA